MTKNVILLAILSALGVNAYAQDVQNVSSTYAEKFSSALKTNKVAVENPSKEQTVQQEKADKNLTNEQQSAAQETVIETPTKTVIQKEDAIQPKVVKRNKPYQPKTVEISSTTVSASVVELPNNIPLEEIGKFLKPISSDDISIKVVDTDSDYVKFKLVDDRTGQPLKQNNLNGKISTLSANSSLIKFKFSEETIDQDGIISSPKVSGGNCQALYVSYDLNNSKSVATKTIVLDKLDETLNSNGEKCKLANVDANETTFYTNSGYIVNLAFDKKKSSNGHVAFTANMSKDGRAFSSHDTVAYAVSKNMMKAFKLNVKHDSRGAFFGSRVDQEIPSGIYYIVLGFSYEGQPDYVVSILNVN